MFLSLTNVKISNKDFNWEKIKKIITKIEYFSEKILNEEGDQKVRITHFLNNIRQ
jgi:tRNA splicing ligase